MDRFKCELKLGRSFHFSSALHLGHASVNECAGIFARLDDACLKPIATLADVTRETRLQFNQQRRITRNKDRNIRWWPRLAIVNRPIVHLYIGGLPCINRIAWRRVVRRIDRGRISCATPRKPGGYCRLKGAVIVTGVVPDLEALLITVAIVFNCAPGLVERPVAALVVLIAAKVAGSIIGDIVGAGAVTI